MTIGVLRSAIGNCHGVRFALVREVEGSVRVFILVSARPDDAARTLETARLIAKRYWPAGVRIDVGTISDDDLTNMIEGRDALLEKQAAIIARYEELAPELKLADSTLEILKAEERVTTYSAPIFSASASAGSGSSGGGGAGGNSGRGWSGAGGGEVLVRGRVILTASPPIDSARLDPRRGKSE